MNRRLHNTSLAASASGVLLLCTLLLAMSSQTGAFAAPSALTTAAIAAPAFATTASRVDDRQQALEARLEAKASAFEARMARTADTASVGDTVASVMAFAAEVTADAALVGAFGALADQDATDDQDMIEAEQRRHARRARGALAVPYFSFAQGLRSSGS